MAGWTIGKVAERAGVKIDTLLNVRLPGSRTLMPCCSSGYVRSGREPKETGPHSPHPQPAAWMPSLTALGR